jgi:uncharacterized protein
MIPREVNLPQSEHFFLFGARGVGKSTLLTSHFLLPKGAYINLLDANTENELAKRPEKLRDWLAGLPEQATHVVIDEIQKVPKLLNVVHQIIEERTIKQKIVMTGSSARKLKAGGANLLAGRAFLRHLFPLTEFELKQNFDIDRVLQFGTLPKLLEYSTSYDKIDYLFSYAHMYLREEVWSEHLVKNLDLFRKFLEVAAQSNGKELNFTKVSNDVGVDVKTVQNYFSILEDTLLGFFLESFHTSIRKRLKCAPKFYFFDVGVARTLSGFLPTAPQPKTSYYGELFEQFLVSELYRRISYNKRFWKLCYLKTASSVEIDVVIERPGQEPIFIEIKSTDRISNKDTQNLNHFGKEFPDSQFYVFSQDERAQKIGVAKCLHWREGLEEILR